MGLHILNTPLQTQGGSGGSEALSLSKCSRCCSRVCALVKKLANCSSEGTYWRSMVCCWQWDRVKKASTPICFVSLCFVHRIIGNLDGSSVITRRGVATSQKIPKTANNHRSHTISKVVVASARSSASVLEQDTAACFLDFHAIGEEPRRIQYPVMERRSVGSLAQVKFE